MSSSRHPQGNASGQTLAVAELCRRQGVIPELSFMVAPPDDPEGETERTFEFIREVKRVNPQAEIIVYIYTPLPAESLPVNSRPRDGGRAQLADVRGTAAISGTSAKDGPSSAGSTTPVTPMRHG